MQTSRGIIHVDMDCFFVAVERLHDPSLHGIPVATGGSPDGRGVVSSASYEARAFGVRSAMPMGQALRLCPHLRVVSGGGHGRYGEYSHRLRAIFLRFTPLVQMASLDEAYLDLAGTGRLWGSPLQAAHLLREAVFRETQLSCSLGAGTSKLVAKIASGLCKPRGLLYVPAGSEERFLAPLPVRKLPGIGPRTAERLASVGIRELGELAALKPSRAEALFGEHGPALVARAKGEDRTPVLPGESAKSIGAEETLGRDTRDPDELHSLVMDLCEKVAFRLRRHGSTAATVTLKYRFANFETHTASTTLHQPANDDSAILEAASRLLRQRVLSRPESVRLLGVTASNLSSGFEQTDVFEVEASEKRKRLLSAVDRLRGKHGYDSIRRAGGTSPDKRDSPPAREDHE